MEGINCFATFNQLSHVDSSANEVANIASVIFQRRFDDLAVSILPEGRRR